MKHKDIILTVMLITLIIAVLFLEQKARDLEKKADLIYIRYKQSEKNIKHQDSINQLNIIHIKSLHNLLDYKPLRHLKPKADSLNQLYNPL